MKRLLKMLVVVPIIAAMIVPQMNVFAVTKSQSSTNVLSNVEKNNDIQIRKNISVIEEDLKKQGINVKDSLDEKIKNLDNKIQLSGNDVEKSKLKKEKAAIEDLLNSYVAYKDGIVTYSENHTESDLSAAVATVIVYFHSKKYYLSEELLVHAEMNEDLDSHYFPDRGNEVYESPVLDKIRSNHKQSGSSEFPNKGSTVQKDLYYSIHKFNYLKSGYHIIITDRYDFKYGTYSGIAGIAVDTMYLAQQAGILVPFFTYISVT